MELPIRLCLATTVSVALLVWIPWYYREVDQVQASRRIARRQAVVIDRLVQEVRRRENYNEHEISVPTISSVQKPVVKNRKPVEEKRSLLIAHVINPIPSGHGLHVDQEITFASLVAANQAARDRGIDVIQYTSEFYDDLRAEKPASFTSTPDLTRHAHQVYEMESRGVMFRKLPLISDILDAIYQATAPYASPICTETIKEKSNISYQRIMLVYTNTDIAVQKNFYSMLQQYATTSEAFIINRVETPDKDARGRSYGVADLQTLYKLGKERPQLHAGYDCFVWDRRLTPFLRLYVRGLFVGYPPVGKHLKDAMNCISGKHFREIRGKKYTFHVGDRNGGWSQFPEFEHYNRKAAKRAEADFPSIFSSSFRRNRITACNAAREAAMNDDGNQNNNNNNLVCLAHEELRLRSFLRWDQPGSEWPPKPVVK